MNERIRTYVLMHNVSGTGIIPAKVMICTGSQAREVLTHFRDSAVTHADSWLACVDDNAVLVSIDSVDYLEALILQE